MKTNGHLLNYSSQLRQKFENDIKISLDSKMSLIEPENKLIKKLIDDKMFSSSYNMVIGKIEKIYNIKNYQFDLVDYKLL